jgi:hypothetical protein
MARRRLREHDRKTKADVVLATSDSSEVPTLLTVLGGARADVMTITGRGDGQGGG